MKSINRNFSCCSIFMLKIALFFLLGTLIIVSQMVWDITALFNIDAIQLWLTESEEYAPLLYIAAMTAAVVISPIPSVPLDIAAGAFFGPLIGTIYSALGALAGAAISFIIARYLGRDLIEKFIGGHINFCRACSNKVLTKIVFFSRLIPFVSFDVVSYGAGLTSISLLNFCVASFFGMLPLTFVYNYFGSVLLINKGLSTISGLFLVVLFFLIPRWIERYDLFSLKKMIRHSKKKRR